ncbi:hypothetical protein PTT65_04275 [Serratia ureilytica]|uniref:hypothetical protein n=1 Tax=Serratia ureilytica TaxID=300181 RepID=UPI00313AB84C
MDKLREEFEQWWKSEYGAPLSDFNELWCAEGGYCDEDLDRQWEAWQASRASIVVENITPSEAPSGLIYQIGGAGLSHDEAICEGYSAGFNEAIRSIGLSIKGE